MFCRELVADLRAAVAADPSLPPVLLFALAKPEHGDAFFAERWPQVPVVYEASGRFHRDLLGARRARFWELLAPKVWRRVMQARRKGHRQGPAQADVWRLGGAMLVRDRAVLWRTLARDVSEHFDLDAVPRAEPGSGVGAPTRGR